MTIEDPQENYHTGFIRLYRSFAEWEWYGDINTRLVFLHCLLKANWKDKKHMGQTICRGSFVTGLKVFADEVGLSMQNVRTSFGKLKSTNDLTIETSSKGSVIQVVNFDVYQSLTNELTNHQQTTNKRLTTTNKLITKEVNISFDQFWDAYDKKVGKSKCEILWHKLNDKDRQAAIDHIPKYKLAQPEKKFRKDPQGFLNQRKWEDELIINGSNGQSGQKIRRSTTGNIYESIKNPDFNG